MMNFFNEISLFLNAGLAILIGVVILLNRRNNRQVHEQLETLQKNEENQRSLVKTVPSIIFKGYADGTADFFDDQVEKVTGYPVDEFNSHRMKWTDIILPEDMEQAQEAFDLALKTNSLYIREYRIKAKSGAIRWIRERGHIILDAKGKIDSVTSICTDITKAHEIEAGLRQSEEKYRLLIESIPSVVFKGYAGGYIEFFNQKIQELTGYPMEDFNSRKIKWLDVMVPEDASQVSEAVKQAVMGRQEGYMREYRIITKAGKVIWVRARGRILYKENGQVDFISGTFSDITAQHELQAAMSNMQHQNEKILNSLGEGLVELDKNGEVIFVNPAALKLIEFEGKELMGRSLHELTHQKKADGSFYPKEECPIHNTIRDGEGRLITDDVFWTRSGNALPVAYQTNAIIESDEIAGVVLTFRDITWRKKAEAELKQTSQFMENIIENSAEGIGIVDRHGTVVKWNKASESIYGYTFKELQGKKAFELYADKDALARMSIQLRQKGYVRNYEIPMLRKDGSVFPCSLSIKVLRDEDGLNMGSVTIVRDLTEEKEKEAKLRAANEQLQVLVNESTQRNRNMTLLQEMSDVFQSCQTSGETYSAIAHFVPQFFPDYGGALYILNNSKNLFEMTSIWGDISSLEMVFGQDECWSLRRTRAYLVHDSKTTMNCRHVSAEAPGSYLCVPMMAQGEIIGIFHLRKNEPEEPEEIKAVGQFATTVAEAMALALANLRLRETLRNQAIRDGLTGLFNRRYLEETLERELSRNKRQGSPLGVIMLDLDHFKEYNDNYGHEAGDELLIALGHMIQDQVRREDIACRYGGEEFLLIMPGATLEITLDRAKEVNQGVKKLHQENHALKPITISAGVAVFPDHGATGKEVVRAADAALYRAKEEGRDRVVTSSSSKKGVALAN
jgi:diguanylate cyclase (GGDEF)-like protein/PAS domain S-box-containing protein